MDEGYGYGETITLKTSDTCTVSGFMIMNGYCSSEPAWENNSRVRKFLASRNSSPVCVPELEDTSYSQAMQFPEVITLDTGDSITLEIIEVYPGIRYDDTAISELSCTID